MRGNGEYHMGQRDTAIRGDWDERVLYSDILKEKQEIQSQKACCIA
jgi:hypothetical protein